MKNEDLSEFLLICVNNLVINSKANIKSAWPVIKNLIESSMTSMNPKIVQISFSITKSLIRSEDDYLVTYFNDMKN